MSLSKLQPSVSQCPDVGPSPNQPRNISLPEVSFGIAKPVLRAFNASWFDNWGWLHWDESSEHAFCFTCVNAFKEKLKCGTVDTASSQEAILPSQEAIGIGKVLLFLFTTMRVQPATSKQSLC